MRSIPHAQDKVWLRLLAFKDADAGRRDVEYQEYLGEGEYHGNFSQGENIMVIEEIEEYLTLLKTRRMYNHLFAVAH